MPDLPALLPPARQLVRDIDALGAQLPPDAVDAIHRLLRDTTTYYSNLIEGHDTHPIFLDAARNGLLAKVPTLRDRQLEALAHVKTQERYETALENEPDMNVNAPGVILGVRRTNQWAVLFRPVARQVPCDVNVRTLFALTTEAV